MDHFKDFSLCSALFPKTLTAATFAFIFLFSSHLFLFGAQILFSSEEFVASSVILFFCSSVFLSYRNSIFLSFTLFSISIISPFVSLISTIFTSSFCIIFLFSFLFFSSFLLDSIVIFFSSFIFFFSIFFFF